MKKIFLSKILIVILLILMVINNVSYAINIEKEQFKKSLIHMFRSDVRISNEYSMPGFSGHIAFSYRAPSELEIKDNQITMREVGEIDNQRVEISLVMDYFIDEEKVTFKMKTDVNEYLKYEPEDEIAFATASLLRKHTNCMTMGYLALADNLDMDLNLVATYFEQCANNDETETPEEYKSYTSCDLFFRTLKFDENSNTIEALMEINLDEFSKINQSLLDGTVQTTIEFLNEYKDESDNEETNTNTNTNESANNTFSNEISNNTLNDTNNNVVNNVVNNAVNNAVNNTANNVINKTTNTSNNITNNQIIKPVDNTTSNKIIPEAGSEAICYIMFSLVAVSVLFYIKLRKYDDIV